MRESANMVPISVIATDICDNFGDSDRKYFGEHLKNIISVYKTLYIFLMNNVNVKTLAFENNTIIDLPCDFVRETKIGVINDQGRIATLSIDKNLRIPVPKRTHKEVSAAIEEAMLGSAIAEFLPFYNYYGFDGNYIAEMRGYSCALNNLGYFNVDREERTLVISNIPENLDIIMEYKSDGVSEGLHLVPTELVNCITSKCKSKFCLDKKDNRFQAYQLEHELEYKLVKRLYNATPIDIYAQLFKPC